MLKEKKTHHVNYNYGTTAEVTIKPFADVELKINGDKMQIKNRSRKDQWIRIKNSKRNNIIYIELF